MNCNSDKCHCPRCVAGFVEDKLLYTVKSYKYEQPGYGGRSGTIYQIMESRQIATSKCLEDADLIASALNTRRVMERKVEALERQRTLTPTEVREAMKAEVENLPTNCHWSSRRKTVVDFGQAVLKRIGCAPHYLI